MIQAIISPDNKQIKFAAALRLKKYRDETGMFLLEGIHLLEAALAALEMANLLREVRSVREA